MLIRPATSLEALSALKPAFRADGVVTAGTSSPLTDGAAMVLVTTEAFAARAGLTPLARIRSFATVGVDPAVMGIGPIPATRLALERAGLTLADLDLIELNEAFASQVLAVLGEWDLSDGLERVNVNGSGISLGHPVGATGTIMTVKAMYELERTGGRYGLITMCIGGGQGIAMIIERC